MSDEPDSTTTSKRRELLRRLEQTHRQLEEAHTDYLRARTESEQALRQVVDSVGELSEIVRSLLPSPEATDAEPEGAIDEPAEDSAQTPDVDDTDKVAEDDEPVEQAVVDADQPENRLPARLNSRGVAIPEADQQPAPAAPTSETSPAPRPKPRVALSQPGLVDAPLPDDPASFSGLDPDRRIVLTNDGFGVAPALNEILSAEGFRVRIDSRRPELSAPADTVIFLGSLRAPSDLDDAMSVVDDAMYTADQMTTRLMQPDSAFIAAVDTSGGFGVDEFEPVTAPFGALLGLVELLDRRHPGAATKLVDLDGSKHTGEQIAEMLAEELLSGGDESPVALGAERRQTVEWSDFRGGSRPADWLDGEKPPLVYMPGPEAILSTAVERLAIAHELPTAVLLRPHAPRQIVDHFDQLGIEVRAADYDLDRLFAVMDFLDRLRRDHGPISAVVAESIPANNPDELAPWDVMRPPLDEFNALLAMTINDPLRLLGVGLGPRTPPIIESALRYFARAESLRRREQLRVRLAHLPGATSSSDDEIAPRDFALTEFLAGDEPATAEVRFGSGEH